jgi:hypothetical protein
MINNIDNFLKHWTDEKAQHEPEAALVKAHAAAVSSFNAVHEKFLKCLKVKKSGKDLIAIFSDDANVLIEEYEQADKRVSEIKRDIEEFLRLTGGELSINILADRLHRVRRQINSTEFAARSGLQRTIKKSASSVAEAEQSEAVQAAYDKRDRIKAEKEPVVAELEDKLIKINQILKKYE